ncbi:MAG: DUF1592 domain-containing protein [Bryobacterales bacterium]|nr:DUF1592 domain-containing protein [Bryobacterales bacterium]
MAAFLRSAALALAAGLSISVAATKSFDSAVKPFLNAHCVKCHNAQVQSGSLNLERFRDLEDRDHWEKVLDKLRAGQMPPKGAKKPTVTQVAAVTSWIEGEYARMDRATGPNPGRVTARRLNRYEYNATIRDLLGIHFKPATDFPADDSGYGFDNIGDVLSLSPVLMEKYLRAAEKIARAAIVVEKAPADPENKPTVERYMAERLNQMERLHIEIFHDFPADADYDLRAAWGNRVPVGLQMKGKLLVDGEVLLDTPTSFEETRPRSFEGRFPIKAGPHQIEADLDVGAYDGKVMPWLEFIEIRGPFDPKPSSPGEPHRRIMVCGHPLGQHQPECARRIVAPLARRAFRRPVSDKEVDALAGFVALAQQRGDSLERGVRVALTAILVSPHFLFRIERDAATAGPHRISEHELASRLSYFLWSSMPDEELLAAADRNRLRAPGALEAQVRRMLADPRSRALTENFAAQWLQFRNLETLKPDVGKFPEFDGELRMAMQRETELFFGNLIKEDGNVLDFIDGRYTFVNERLAKHYGFDGVKGREFRKVPLDGTQRSGVLTQASVLTVSSYPTRTSPVIRGKWILENILNTPPPPPPPDVPNLDEKAAGTTGTLRQQLEIHRSNAMCASCHSRMDPLGFGLENYDAIGRWRTQEGSFPLDVAGVLPDGKSFQTPAELKAVLKDGSDAFVRCLSEKLLTYGLGRGLERYDRPAVDSISREVSRDGYRFSRLILGVVDSLPFQMRRGT